MDECRAGVELEVEEDGDEWLRMDRRWNMLALAFSSIGQTNTHATKETCHVLEAMTLASHEFTRH